MKNLFDEATAELSRAKEKHPWDKLTDLERVAVMANEAGEALQAACKIKAIEIKLGHCDDTERWINLRTEIIQTVATAMRNWESLGFDATEKPHPYAEPTTYTQLAAEIGKLVEEKQKAYGDSFGKASEVIRALYPDGVKPEQYSDMLAITRIVDKLFRIATDKDALGESPYRDIAGYGLLGAMNAVKEPPNYIMQKYVDEAIAKYNITEPDENHITVDGVEYEAVAIRQLSCTPSVGPTCAFWIGRCGAKDGTQLCTDDKRADKRNVIWKVKK